VAVRFSSSFATGHGGCKLGKLIRLDEDVGSDPVDREVGDSIMEES
jgi:hypothetical protein